MLLLQVRELPSLYPLFTSLKGQMLTSGPFSHGSFECRSPVGCALTRSFGAQRRRLGNADMFGGEVSPDFDVDIAVGEPEEVTCVRATL